MTTEGKEIQQDDEISLKDLILKVKEIWKYILSKWTIIVAVGVLGASIGVLCSFLKTKEYESKLTFSVIEKGSSGGGMSSLAGQFGFNMGSSGGEGVFSKQNITELLQSRNLIERTLLHEVEINNKRGQLVDYYREINLPKTKKGKEVKEILFPLGLARENFSREQDSLLHVLGNSVVTEKLFITKGKEGDIIKITFANKDELFAKLFPEILIKLVGDYYIQSKTGITVENLKTMEKKADSMKIEFEKALEGRARLADRNFNPARQIMAVEQIKYETTIQLTGAGYGELVKTIEALKLDLAQQTPLIQIIDKPIMPLAKTGLGKIKGAFIGGFLGGFLILAWLLIVRFYRKVMQ